MDALFPTIGLEVHAELKTLTKMFCSCRNDPDEPKANRHVCPVCMGHPGTLPAINRSALEHVLRVGEAVGGTLADFTEFDRKNYFYPDIPKNYQISQYKYPLVSGGMLCGVALTRIHLEEDTARSSHMGDETLVDFNRAGVPLMELVTEPVIHDAETAVSFARELRNLLRYLGASDANLEKGEMRVEANISVAREGAPLGTKVEVKNLNSFKAVEQAIAYEVARHRVALEKGEPVLQETRGWDEAKQKTFSQRSKENSHDYRYFPDPDLPKLRLSEHKGYDSGTLRASLPELPWARRVRYQESLGLSRSSVETLVQDVELGTLFEKVCAAVPAPYHKTAANYLTTDVLGSVNAPGYMGRAVRDLEEGEFGELIRLGVDGALSSRGVKDALSHWLVEGGKIREICERENLLQSSDEHELTSMVLEILSEHEDVAAAYRAGKESSLQFLVGQAMKRSKGRANPTLLQKILREQLAA